MRQLKSHRERHLLLHDNNDSRSSSQTFAITSIRLNNVFYYFFFSTHIRSIDFVALRMLTAHASDNLYLFLLFACALSRWFEYDVFAPLCLVISLEFASFCFYRYARASNKNDIKERENFHSISSLTPSQHTHTHSHTHLSVAFHFVSLMKNELLFQNRNFRSASFGREMQIRYFDRVPITLLTKLIQFGND